MARKRLVFLLLLLVAASQLAAATPASSKPQLIYSIKEARAYAVKASLAKEVIEAVPKCKPEEDPYQCAEYNHKPNCPKPVAIGRDGKAPEPSAPEEATPLTGGSGMEQGETKPPESSPVRLNRFLALAKLTHVFDVREAGGLASSLFTDLSGRTEPEAHTESEGFGNKSRFEERCYWSDGSNGEEDYEHFVSESSKELSTYHLAECKGRQCQFGAGVNAERARSIIKLEETKGEVIANLRSSVEGFDFGDGLFTVDSIVTYASFKSDGTAEGARWSVSSTATGAKLLGQPVPMPPGEVVNGPGFTAGIAEPYVEVPENGHTVTMVAPGLHFGSEQQSVFFGGAELFASMGREEPFVFEPDIDDPGDPTTTGTGGGGSGPVDLGTDSAPSGTTGGIDFGPSDTGGSVTGSGAETPVGVGNPGVTLLFEKATGIGAVPSIVVLGLLCWMLLLARWLQRYTWGQKLTQMQPFRFIDWMYRAFVKT